jgi:hypothetical protein
MVRKGKTESAADIMRDGARAVAATAPRGTKRTHNLEEIRGQIRSRTSAESA